MVALLYTVIQQLMYHSTLLRQSKWTLHDTCLYFVRNCNDKSVVCTNVSFTIRNCQHSTNTTHRLSRPTCKFHYTCMVQWSENTLVPWASLMLVLWSIGDLRNTSEYNVHIHSCSLEIPHTQTNGQLRTHWKLSGKECQQKQQGSHFTHERVWFWTPSLSPYTQGLALPHRQYYFTREYNTE